MGNPNFLSWQGQLQYLHSFSDRIRLLTRLSAQLSPDTLPTLEKCAIGGLNGNQFIFGNTVRGYSTNVRDGDNCLAASLEAWFILASDPNWGTLSLVPFIDFGTVWDNEGSVFAPNTLISTGLGLRWQIDEILSLRLDYGIPLKDVPQSEIEEQRWNFSLFLGTRF